MASAAASSIAFAGKLVGPVFSSAKSQLPLSSFLRRQAIPRPSLILRRRTLATISASSSPTTAAAATIAVGDKLPDATLSYLDAEGELQTVSVADLAKGKKVVLFAVPGAFTPTCSQKHLPGFVEKAGELRGKGVDTIACVSVNDAFVMKAWKENLNIGDQVLLLSDGNLQLTRALGVELDLSDKPIGLGVRSRRFSLLAVDGVVTVLNLEEGGAFTVSGADDILQAL
ncbi:thioredoxin superfamily protein [Wolffia australiana]